LKGTTASTSKPKRVRTHARTKRNDFLVGGRNSSHPPTSDRHQVPPLNHSETKRTSNLNLSNFCPHASQSGQPESQTKFAKRATLSILHPTKTSAKPVGRDLKKSALSILRITMVENSIKCQGPHKYNPTTLCMESPD
jgi:hypothetical protein